MVATSAEFLLEKNYEVHGIVRRIALEGPVISARLLLHIVPRLHLHAVSLKSDPSIYQVVAKDRAGGMLPSRRAELCEATPSTTNFPLCPNAYINGHPLICSPRCGRLRRNATLYFAGFRAKCSARRGGRFHRANGRAFIRGPAYGRDQQGGRVRADVEFIARRMECTRATGFLFPINESPRRGYRIRDPEKSPPARRWTSRPGKAKTLQLGGTSKRGATGPPPPIRARDVADA